MLMLPVFRRFEYIVENVSYLKHGSKVNRLTDEALAREIPGSYPALIFFFFDALSDVFY